MKRLTDHQQAILGYLISYTEEHFYQPTVADMAAHFGCAANAIWESLRCIERKGWIQLTGKSRAIEILDRTSCLRETSEVA